MATAAKKAIKSQPSKKDIKHDIIQKLEAALIHLKDILGEKKFNSKIKKASKIFTHATPQKAKVKKAIPVAGKKATTVKKKAIVKNKKVVKKETAKK